MKKRTIKIHVFKCVEFVTTQFIANTYAKIIFIMGKCFKKNKHACKISLPYYS